MPAWSRNLTTKIKRRPKVHLIDSGFAAWLRGESADALSRPGNARAGPLLETFVVNELLKLCGAADVQAELYHFRDRDGREIDCILEAPDGRVVAIEVKASSTVDKHDVRHLALARDRLGDQFLAGIIFYTGPRPLPFGDRMMVLPISLLWGGGPAPR